MLGLNVYVYIDGNDTAFYKTQRALAKRMDILDWIPGSYAEDNLENPQDRARHSDPADGAMVAVSALLVEPLAQLYPGSTSRGAVEEDEEEEEGDEEEEEEEREVGEEGATGFTQESEAPQRKKAMRSATPQSKLVPAMTVDDAREMLSRDPTETFRAKRKLKGKKLYGDYAGEETIAISSEDEDDYELGKALVRAPDSPSAVARNIRPKPETLTVDERNARAAREEEHRLRMERDAGAGPSVRDEVAELKALLLQQRAMPPPPPTPEMIASIISNMWAQGTLMAPPSAFPHLPPNFPPQQIQQPPLPQPSFAFQHMVGPPQVRPYAPVQQVDDPHLWRQGAPGSSRPMTPPPLRPPLLMPPPHQLDDPRLFGSADPNLAGPSEPRGPPADRGQFGSADPNATTARSDEDNPMVDVEGPQGPGDTSTPSPDDDAMHDVHAEVGLGQRADGEPLQEQVAADVAGEGLGGRGQSAEPLEAETASRRDQGEVIH